MSPARRAGAMADLRSIAAPALAAMLVLTACIVVIASVVRGEHAVPTDRVLALLGALLAPAMGLLADPGRHGRSTDPDPPAVP